MAKFNYKKAKEAGYTDEEINNFLSKEKDVGNIQSASSAYLKGLAEESHGINPLGNFGPVPLELGKKVMEHFLPSKEEHEWARRAGKLTPVVALGEGSLPLKAAELAASTLGGEYAKEEGLGELGQTLTEAASMGLPGLVKGVTKAGIKAIKSTPSKLPSGLNEISAIDSKLSKFGTISKERQAAVIGKLNQEASKIAEKSVEKHLPISKELKKGVDLEGRLHEDFGKLKLAAEKSNPEIDITPISELLSENSKKYKGIPNPSSEVKSIISEVKALRNKPQTGLSNLLKIFRDNNKKMKHIYETAMIGGKQEEYVNFLRSLNKSIEQSFERTLPEDSAWLSQFKKLNNEFREIKNAEKTTGRLKGILSSKPKLSELDKLISDVKTQERLRLSMGKEGANEIIQIASDLRKSHDALKKMPSKQFNKFDHAFPLYYLIPFVGKAIGGYKTAQAGRYFLGWIMSTPSRRRAYTDALNAFAKSDLEGYKKATAILKSELDKKKS